MVAYADTGFIVSLYLPETTSQRAIEVARRLAEPLPVTPLILLEFRNALNLAMKRDEINTSQRDAIWRTFETDISDGIFIHAPVSLQEVHRHARQLSDRHTFRIGTRSLDLLHIATAITLGAKGMFTFDERQAKAARAEGLKVKP
jgi:predicted nucleic acid-binding protein